MRSITSVVGPPRQFAVTLQLGRFRGEADADRSSLLANCDANDPEPTRAAQLCVSTTPLFLTMW